MATPGQLVQTMADALGIPVETVTNYDRVLSENGMRSKSGCGRGSAKVTAGDAANLLIAIMGSPIAGASVKEAANTCRNYGSMRASRNEGSTHDFAKVNLKVLDELPKKHTLYDAISALIQSAAKGEHYRKPKQDPIDRFRIRLLGPHPGAEIVAVSAGVGRLGGEGGRFALREYGPLYFDSDQAKKDLYQERYVSYRTIRILGSLLSEPMSKI
jgi:hypothetical protein